jgi:hypothetical protein
MLNLEPLIIEEVDTHLAFSFGRHGFRTCSVLLLSNCTEDAASRALLELRRPIPLHHLLSSNVHFLFLFLRWAT